MDKKHTHSPIKIIDSLGYSSEKDKGISTLTDFIRDNNATINEMIDYIKIISKFFSENKVKDEINEALKDNNELLTLKIKERTDEVKTYIVQETAEKIESTNKYLILKIGMLAAGISSFLSLIIGYILTSINTTSIEQINQALDLILTSLNLK